MLQFTDRLSAKARLSFLLLAALQISSCKSPSERAQAYYEHGATLLAQNDNQRAALEFKNAVMFKRDLVPAWRGLAQIEEANRHWTELVPILRTILEVDPKDDLTRLKLAKLLLVSGAADQSLKLVNEADVSGTNNASFMALKAVILYKLEERDAAIREAKTALEIEHGNVDALKVLAANRLANGDPKGALQLLSNDSLDHTTDLGVQLLKIKINEQLGDLSGVESSLQNLIALYPHEAEFRKQIVKFYIDQHRLSDAENLLRAIAGADPNNSGAELDLVRFLYNAKGIAGARNELASRIGAGGDVFPYQMALAELDFAEGNYADSFKLLETLLLDASSAEHVLAAKIKLAELNLGRGNKDATNGLLFDILSRDGHNTAALRLRAIISMESGRPEAAIADLHQALDNQPGSTELELLLATAYERNGSLELAEREYADATRTSAFDARIGLSYAAFLRRRGRIQRAEDVLTELANRQPKDPAILSALAEIKLTRQDWIGAQQIGESLRSIGDSNDIAGRILEAALSGQRRVDEIHSALAVTPATVPPMVSLVRSLVHAKQIDRALSFLQTVLQTEPENAEAYVLLGSIQLANNAPDQAVGNFTAAIEKQPKNIVGYRALAEFYLNQKDNDEALKTIRAGLRELPDNIILHIALADIFERTEDYEAAISEYEYVLGQQPDSLIVVNNLASMLLDHRTDADSLERAQALVVSLHQSQVPQFKDTLGWAAYRRGDFKAAVAMLEVAAAALPDVAVVHYHLGMSYVATGQEAKASKEFEVALTKPHNTALADAIRAELTKMGKP